MHRLLWAYLALAGLAMALFAVRRLTGWAYVLLAALTCAHALALGQDFRLRLNQHYMAQAVWLTFLFVPDRRRTVRYLVLAFYVWAGALKLNREWLSGAALYGRPLGVPEALLPAACAYVVLLEMVLVFGLLARRPWLFYATLGQVLAFHVASVGVVGLFYPAVMFTILAIFPLARWLPDAGPPPSPGRLLRGREPAPVYAVLGAFSFLQLLPALFPGDAAVTGEGRLFALHMFDARVVCEATATVRARSGEVQNLVFMFQLPTRIRCDPIVYWNVARALCRKLGSQPDFDDLDLYLRSRRTTEPALRPVIALKGFCRAAPAYDVWRPNPWILRA